jgi:transposase InsO family protein
VFYRWKKRYDKHGEAGLADRPRTPHHFPRAMSPAVVGKVLYLHQNYHFGAYRIAAFLKRFHQIEIALSTLHRILGKSGMGRLPANQKHQPYRERWKRYEKAQPGHRLQMEVKRLEHISGTGKRLNQFAAIDDCTRIRVLKVCDASNQRTAICFLNEVRNRLPFRIHVVQTDNGAEFQSRFHWHAELLDIRHVHIRLASPHLNGKVERSHRIDQEGFYQMIGQNGISDETA